MDYKCEVLTPCFVDKTSLKLNIKDYDLYLDENKIEGYFKLYSDGTEEKCVSKGGKFENIEEFVILVDGNTASAALKVPSSVNWRVFSS